MDYFLSEEQIEIQNLAEKITREKVRPVRAALDEKEEFPGEIMNILADAGLFAIFLPEAYDGLGGGMLELALATEESPIQQARIGLRLLLGTALAMALAISSGSVMA